MSAPVDIAIIGMAGLFPGCRDKDAYWENILARADNLTEAPDSWAMPWYDPERAGTTLDSGRIRTRKIGLLGDLATFDPLEFGIPPKAVEGDPAHFVALQLAGDALRDAGYRERPFDRERTGVIVGHGYNPNRGDVVGLQYGLAIEQTVEVVGQLLPQLGPEALEEVREALKRSLPQMQIEQAPSLISNVISGRIANRLDLMGPNYLVDAACASTHLALDAGIRDLTDGRCDMMVVGGVQASMPAQIYMLFETLGALSPTDVRPFDQAANGTLLSEGAGFVVLKRLADAVRDDDRIYAVVKGVGVASDGKATGLLAPRLEGERSAIERAYRQTGIDPATIGLVEAHGTGIPLGDQTEIQALSEVFGQRGDGPPRIALGSVKSMIGHCIPASGTASIIKTALALHYRILPPTLCDEVRAELRLEQTPFYLNTEARPWIQDGARPRRAGINAFGFGGINAHAILEEYRSAEGPEAFGIGRWLVRAGAAGEQPGAVEAVPADRPCSGGRAMWSRWPTELVVFAAADRKALAAELHSTLSWLRDHPDVSLDRIACAGVQKAAAVGGAARLACVATGPGELAEQMELALARLEKGGRDRFSSPRGVYFAERAAPRGKVAFLFSSEGSQYAGMLADLCLYLPKAGGWFDFLDDTFPRSPRPSDCLFPPPTCLTTAEAERLAHQLYAGDLATESVSTASQIFYELLRDLGVDCDFMAGHSAGEHAALRASGKARTRSLGHLQEEMRLLNRVYAELEAGPGIPTGKVLSVGALDYEAIDAVLQAFADRLFLVADNCPSQVILFAAAEAAAGVVAELRSRGGICVELPFDRAYHTPLFAAGTKLLRRYYENVIEPDPGGRVVYSCSTAAPYPADRAEGLEIAARQWMTPVRFRETVEAMYRDGARIFVELGASNSLTAFVDSILKGRDYLALPCNAQGRPALEQFLRTLGRLFVEQVPMDLAPLYEARGVNPAGPGTAEGAAVLRRRIRLRGDLPRLSLDERFVARFHERHPLAAAPAAQPPRRLDLAEAHFELMNEFLSSQVRVTEMLRRHLDAEGDGGPGGHDAP